MSQIIHPFITKKNYCMHCGAEDKLRYIDLHDDSHYQMIFVTSKAKCEKCGTEYFIHWVNEDGEMVPYYSDKDIIDDFSKDIIRFAKEHKRKLI